MFEINAHPSSLRYIDWVYIVTALSAVYFFCIRFIRIINYFTAVST